MSQGDERGPGLSFPPGGVFTAALDGVIVMDADGRVRDWNPAAEDIFGYSWNEAVGEELAELVIPPAYRDDHRAAYRRYLETRRGTILDRRLELWALRRDGSEFPVELTVTRVPDVEPPLFAGFVRDLTEREAAQRENRRLQERMAFLAQAGLALDVSLDLDETLRRLAHLTVPELAELAVIDLLSDSGSIRGAVAASATRPEMAKALEHMRERYPIDRSGAHPVARVLASGKPVLLPKMSPEVLREFAQSPEHYDLMLRFRYRSALVVPLPARSRLLGTLSLLRMADGTPYDEHDLLLAETLGRRAGLALENARLYESTRRISQTLQRSLLPRALPKIRGAQLAARYLAAEGHEVGGDFYDVFPIGGARSGIAIGDVCGKGPEAAALTALARYTIRAVGERGPATALTLLNEAVIRDQGPYGRFLTASFAELSNVGDDLVVDVAVAGHPAPVVLLADGGSEQVRVEGPLLGVVADVSFTPVRVVLHPGDKIVFYTDGLTDARAPDLLSEDDLAGLLSKAPALDAESLAAFLESVATADCTPRDDIAIVVIEAVGAARPAAATHRYAAGV